MRVVARLQEAGLFNRQIVTAEESMKSIHLRWALAATAHPAKFREIVEPILGESVPLPPALAALMSRPSEKAEIEPDLAALKRALLSRESA